METFSSTLRFCLHLQFHFRRRRSLHQAAADRQPEGESGATGNSAGMIINLWGNPGFQEKNPHLVLISEIIKTNDETVMLI